MDEKIRSLEHEIGGFVPPNTPILQAVPDAVGDSQAGYVPPNAPLVLQEMPVPRPPVPQTPPPADPNQ